MARVKRAVNAVKKRRKIMRLAKGYYGAKSKQYRTAKQSVMKSLAYSYRGRKQRKRDFRKLWITRINAGARENGLTYSKLMNGLKLAGITLNRKVLAEMAVNDPAAFAEVVKAAEKALGTGTKKTAVKKPAAKKPAAKADAVADEKPAAKKTTAKAEEKPAAKKPAAKKAAPKAEEKPAAKKPAAKKPAAKKEESAE